ncbi:DHH family phosphoesterase [Lacticaseibacillus mingshuiensis]|uniref:Bifunctional oligoribonuclease/PAP phosphatase NrnA n=1 Tax=Lacticaseibacillus mingshuiensis TaxID=2799574 RepID=A0ABW4CDW0_9LACO|nr:bifunctional oligoribonuclease/PAP phosphatase NrnA [Lacticaseibacillus mingshuiensis]
MIQQEILSEIQKYDTIIIHRHINPDPDALGSQIGLAEILRASFPAKHIYQVGSEVGDLAWFGQEQVIADDLYQDALVIVTDTADTPRVSDDRFTTGKMLIKIDHHPNDDPYAKINWVDNDASSASELIFDLVAASDGLLTVNAAAARMLYGGIVGDTGRFLYNNTTPHTFQVAAELIKQDFDPAKVNNQMNSLTLAQARLQSYVFDHLTVTPAGAASVVIPQTTIQGLGLADDEVSAAVGTPGRLAEVQSWLEFVEKKDGTYRVHLRSKGPIINELAKAHNGGGHPLASGANAQDQAEIDEMIAALAALVETYQKAGQNG